VIRWLVGARLAVGLTALDTHGHTAGHQSFQIDLGARTIVLACDAADLRRNITEVGACGTTVTPELAPAAERAIARRNALDSTQGCEVWPGHDPEWWAWPRPGTIRCPAVPNG
jgi:glyoxylase-like metal-dependent hydrolase (beta-lactamase superfamily II)